MNGNVIFTYNQDDALAAGQGGFINESGAYVITISEAKLGMSESGAKFIEFSGEEDDGRKVNYLSIYSTKRDGEVNKFGHNLINAIMGCSGVQQLTQVKVGENHFIAPEFSGKRVGLVLQKVLKTKTNGNETYSFDIKIPFFADTRQTLAEKIDNAPAVTIDKILASLKDKDERRQQSQSNQGYGYPQSTDDDAPF
ncbi:MULTISPECIES: DUF669 domain-containing protein [unclassified Shigella]|uniref:DUF669 domain-containing protein n=1 Tax=unclassified Shigella TaxID=2629414 RepID=UPI000848226B|nr:MULTISPECIES: DUF669 domain-containing protein [unclassified Shigella]ODQ07167.1 DUF669 domain-containing protein [Shigella sp. FC130]OEI94563.1 DUF669 domain-containing protein [Shigella sp. FC1655]OEJ02980.1 DUF669 domain-containing protein [Shigella sp. FC1967]